MRSNFWQEIIFLKQIWDFPWVLLDGILVLFITYTNEKGGGNGHDHQRFNSLIMRLSLWTYLFLIGYSFVWSNLQERLVLTRLYIGLVSSDCEIHLPLATKCILPRSTSDLAPLCLDTREFLVTKRKIFRFEKIWLEAP